MSFTVESAIETLGQAALARQADERFAERLGDVRDLLCEDLATIERGLEQALESGLSPGRDAAQHLIRLGGKRVRPMALLLSAACFGGISPAARQLALVAELLHSATLLHDDVVDDGMERRGAVTARRLWGNAVSVLGGDFVLVRSLELTSQHAPELMPSLVATLRQLIDGEIRQLRGRTQLDVSETTYQLILRDKTASLFRWSAQTGAALGGASAEACDRLARFGEHLGIAFQLVDDVLDYSGQQTGKTLLADLAEGKLTLPLVLAVAARPELAKSLERIHAGDRAPVESVGEQVVQSGVCEIVRQRAREHTDLALQALAPIPGSAAKGLLGDVAQQLAARVA